MNAAARAKTPGIKRRSKTAANPWQGLPRLADLFDRATPQPFFKGSQPFFKGSKVPGLEELALTETQLLEQTAALLGVSLAQLLRTGALGQKPKSPPNAYVTSRTSLSRARSFMPNKPAFDQPAFWRAFTKHARPGILNSIWMPAPKPPGLPAANCDARLSGPI